MSATTDAVRHYQLQARDARAVVHYDRLIQALRTARNIAQDGGLPAAKACADIERLVEHTLTKIGEVV